MPPSNSTTLMHGSASAERISFLESRADGVDATLDSHGTRIADLEGKIVDVRLGMKDLHNDLNLNTAATRQVAEEVRAIKGDTTQMLAEYRAKPEQRAQIGFAMKLVAGAWAAVVAITAVVHLYLTLKAG